ncbi:MAG: right-handed parallel beta-helix repeat-containing protein [Planctomycetota bacterium]|nr:MAG: right-handed parallel beta-helix repeat-containing protein [Planctomycetota bacterium]
MFQLSSSIRHFAASPLAALVCAASLCSGAAAQLVVPLSTLGVIQPNPGYDNRPWLQLILSNLPNLTGGITLVFDQAGTYELHGAMNGASPMLLMQNRHDITITSVPGVTLELRGFDRSVTGGRFPNVLEVYGCNNFTLCGDGPSNPLVITMPATASTPGNEGLPFVQGTFVSKTSTTATIKVTDPALFMPVGCVSSLWAWAVRNGVPGYDAMYEGTLTPAGSPSGSPPIQLLTMTFPSTAGNAFTNWVTDEPIVATLNDSDTYALVAYGNPGTTTFRDVLVHYLPGKCVQIGNDHCVVENVDIAPASSAHLSSVSRDGINAAGDTVTILDCDVAFAGDDAIVVNGSSYGEPLGYSIGDDKFHLVPPLPINDWPTYVPPGRFIVALDRTTLSPATMEFARVVSVVQNGPPGPVMYDYGFDLESTGFRALLASGNAVTLNPWYSIPSSLVENCTVEGTRCIGISVRSPNTTVRGCTIAAAGTTGLHAGGGLVDAYPWFAAGAPPHNLLVEYCTFDRCGAVAPHIALTGALEIGVPNDSIGPVSGCAYYILPKYATTLDVIHDVTIRNNLIANAPRSGIFAANVGGTNGLVVTGNTFVDCGSASSCPWSTKHAVVAERCGNGTVGPNNVYVNTYTLTQDVTSNVTFIP